MEALNSVKARCDLFSELPLAAPLPAAVQSGVFGAIDVDDFSIRSLTEEQAREMLAIQLDLLYLEDCVREGRDPKSNKLIRSEAMQQKVIEAITGEISCLKNQFSGAAGAYGDAFGFEAECSLVEFVRKTARKIYGEPTSVVQKKLF